MGADDAMSNALAAERATKLIHNAEIHIFRADPKRHGGREGFLYALSWSNKRFTDKELHPSRGAAAEAAASHLDHIEIFGEID